MAPVELSPEKEYKMRFILAIYFFNIFNKRVKYG